MALDIHGGRHRFGHAGGGIGNISAIGAGHDGVADRVADNIVVAVLVSGEDDELELSE